MSLPLIREFTLGRPNSGGPHPYLSEHGVFLGSGTPMLEKDGSSRWRPRDRGTLERALRKSTGIPVDLGWRMESLGTVARALNKGDRCLAAIALVQAEFPDLPDTGLSKRDVSDEPRVPAGQPDGGQWTSDGGPGTGAVAATTALADGASALLENIGRGALAELGELGATAAGPIALASGLLLVPFQNDAISEDTLPDRPDISYRFDGDNLSIWQTAADGHLELLHSAPPDPDGMFRDEDGKVIARSLGGTGVAINAPAIAQMADARSNRRAQAGAAARADTKTDEPELCPPETPDEEKLKNSVSVRAQIYQEMVSGLPFGMVVRLGGVNFDGCRTSDGTMLEAKGPGYANFMTDTGNWQGWYYDKLQEQLDQMSSQSEAAEADGRIVEWHVAEKPVADFWQAYARVKGFPNVIVIYDPTGRGTQ